MAFWAEFGVARMVNDVKKTVVASFVVAEFRP
jgi:hypothetical protein